jgi:hypothetical protein
MTASSYFETGLKLFTLLSLIVYWAVVVAHPGSETFAERHPIYATIIWVVYEGSVIFIMYKAVMVSRVW